MKKSTSNTPWKERLAINYTAIILSCIISPITQAGNCSSTSCSGTASCAAGYTGSCVWQEFGPPEAGTGECVWTCQPAA